jgi:hypothetical protein
VVAEVERLVRRGTHTTASASDERPDAEVASELDRIDVERPVL